MTPRTRTLLGKNVRPMLHDSVFETPDAIEVESREGYEVNRRRVLYEEVLLVTIHREAGTVYVVSMLLVTLFFAGAALTLQVRLPVAAIIFGILAIPFLVACLIRVIFKLDFVTVFGRRSKAVIRFTARKRRAREVYGRICSRAREAQRGMAAPEPEVPGALDGAPLPPSE